MKLTLIKIVLLTLLLTSACTGSDLTGGAEAGNPNLRDVTGQVSDTVLGINLPLVRQAYAASTCPADTIIAVDADANSTIAEIADDCSFELNLPINTSYSINFTLDDVFVATMIFQSTSTTESTNFVLSAGDTPVDLGVVYINGIFANPEANPYEQNDRDDDGINDYEDTDDDDDGIDDEEDYVDCDGDGYFEDGDDCEEETECEADDADCDGVRDENDNCPDVANEDQQDENNNDIGDECE